MLGNFSYLKELNEFKLFSDACIEAERVYNTSADMCAIGCRKALELSVKWVYSADNTIKMPYDNKLSALIHENSFYNALPQETWKKLPYINKLGNLAVHTDKKVDKSDALFSLKCLYEFVEWIVYCYADEYEEHSFDENKIPKTGLPLDITKIKKQESLLSAKDSLIEKLQKELENLSVAYTKQKEVHKETRDLKVSDISEFETRKKFIDLDLKLMDWDFEKNVIEELEVVDMAGNEGQKGFVDYVLYGKDGQALAVVEAKRTSVDPKVGRKQALLYADCLEKTSNHRPMIFLTNGFETHFWDDTSSPERKVSSVFSQKDLQKLMDRRNSKKDLNSIQISNDITDRYYQKEAIKAICENIEKGFRKNLLVMATGTGKTRVSASLVDVLSRGGYVTNVLFLADRTALVGQAKESFNEHLKNMSLCNLLSNKDDINSRVIFSTYQTTINTVDSVKTDIGGRFFTPAHFDLIIIDESHRSIFKKYRAIFEYFDSILVGLTATPRDDVDRSTYDFFEMESGIPTYAYDYETAVEIDKFLVPFHTIEVSTKFLEEGIKYDELSEEDKLKYEEDFIEDGDFLIEEVPSAALNNFVFNQDTVDTVIQDLMNKGIKVEGGDRIGKTIIFAQNRRHAEFILERFNKLYPEHKGKFATKITHEEKYSHTSIKEFSVADKEPHIAISVDMLDTGIDVPECVNLVFFKKVRSKIKFWQMIGRGTRLCEGLECVDSIDGGYIDKRRFYIFDYCGNFEYFRINKDGIEGKGTSSLTESIFMKQVRIIQLLQNANYSDESYQVWRKELINTVHGQITNLNPELMVVKLKLKYVEKYKDFNAFNYLSEEDKTNLCKEIAPIVYLDEPDEFAKRFDNLIYGLILSQEDGNSVYKKYKNTLQTIATQLENRATIPQVKEKLPLIKSINTDELWKNTDLLNLEKIRKDLRSLIQFLVDEANKKIIYTNLEDPILNINEGRTDYGISQNFENYRLKVEHFIEKNIDSPVIKKLRNNEVLTKMDYKELEKIFTQELGTQEEYKKEFGNTSFGLLIRKVAKLDREAANNAFSKFIDDHSLNQQQIIFVKKVIDYVVANGYLSDISNLMKPPFDRPYNFLKLFDVKQQKEMANIINTIKDNAERLYA